MQTKDTLTLKASSFGTKCELSTQLMDKVAKCGVMDNILSFAAFKNQKELKKSDGAKRSRLTGEQATALGVHIALPIGSSCVLRGPAGQLCCISETLLCVLPAGVTKLSDANDAGTRNSHMCTLILTEGDSAKSLAMSGLSVVGHDHWGVFPLR